MVLAAILLCAAGPDTPKRIRLCADISCPYTCAPGSDHPGFIVEIAGEVFGASGFAVDYTSASWSRCEDDARAGRVDGIMATIMAESPGFVYPKEAVAISSDNFAVRLDDGFAWHGPESLEGRVVGAVRDYLYVGDMGAYIAEHGSNPRRVEFVSGEDAMRKNLAKLTAGRIDLVLDDGNALRYAIETLGLGGKLRVTGSIHTDPVYIAFSPSLGRSRQLADILDDGIRRLRQSGRLAAILDTYHMADSF